MSKILSSDSDHDSEEGGEVELMDLEGVPHVKSESTFERTALAATNVSTAVAARSAAPPATVAASAAAEEALLGCTRSKVVGFAREVKDKGAVPLSQAALDFLSVGHFEGAIDQAYDDGDPVTWAAAMCLAGYPGRAREALESLVAVAVSRIASDATDPLSPRMKADLTQSPQTFDSSPNPSAPSPRSSGVLYTKVNDMIDRVRVTRWYYVCLCLDSAYDIPDRAVVREYFRLAHPKAVEELRAAKNSAQRRRIADGLILRQLSGTQVTFAKIIVGWQLGRYRTAMQQSGLYMGSGGDTSDADDVLVRFVRLMCHMRLGSFSSAADDTDFLMKRCTSPIVKAVGSSVRAAISQRQDLLGPAAKLPPSAARYCYFIAFHAQCLAFLMRGNFDRADESFEAILAHGPRCAYWIAQHFDLEAAVNIAAKETKRLRSNLCSKVGQAHIWLSRYYGVTDVEARADEIIAFCLFDPPREYHRAGHRFDVHRAQAAKAEAEAAARGASSSPAAAAADDAPPVVTVGPGDSKRSSTTTAMAPPNNTAAACDPQYVDIRLQITVHMVRTLVAFRAGDIVTAWQAVNEAAFAAEEILGTYDLCASAGSAVRVLNALVNIGLLLISAGVHPERSLEVLNRVKDVKQTLQECFPEHILSSAAHACIFLAQDDAGEATVVAKKLAHRFPSSLYALGLLTASHAKEGHDAAAQVAAMQACTAYPHNDTARLIYKAAFLENYALRYFYRGVLPVPLVDGDQLHHFVRTFLIGFLVLLHTLLFLALLGINAYIVVQGTAEAPAVLGSTAGELKLAWEYLTLAYRQWPAYIPFGVGLFHLLFLVVPLAASPTSHTGLTLHTLRFHNTAGVRFLWAMRVIIMCNAATSALQFAFNDMKVVNNIATSTMSSLHHYIALGAFGASCIPATTRFLYVRSKDEPEMIVRWVLLLVLDILLFALLIVPHVLLVLIEPVVALFHLCARDGDRPFNLSRPAKFYCACASVLFMGTQSSAVTTTAGLEEDIAVDLKMFPLVKSTNAGSAGFILTIPEEQDLRLRNGAESRAKDKNARTLSSVTDQKRDVIAKRSMLAGIATTTSDDQLNRSNNGAGELTLEVTGPTLVFDPFAVEMVVRKVPHSQDERVSLVKESREGFWYYFVALVDSQDADLYSQLAVPEVVLSLDRQLELDTLSFAYVQDLLIRLESSGRHSLLGAQQHVALVGLSASPHVFSPLSQDIGGGSAAASVTRLSFRSSSRSNSSRAGSRQSMHNRRSSLNETSSSFRTTGSRESVSAATNPLSARESPTPGFGVRPSGGPLAMTDAKAAGRAGSFTGGPKPGSSIPALAPDNHGARSNTGSSSTASGSARQRSASQKGRTEPKDPMVSFVSALQNYADIPSQDDFSPKTSALHPPPNNALLGGTTGTGNRSRASSVASSAASRSRSASTINRTANGADALASTQTSASGDTTGAVHRAETINGNGDVFAKLLAERQAQAAASLKSPFLDPNELVLKLPGPEDPVVDQTPVISGKVSDIRRVQSTLDSRIAKGTTEADLNAIQTLEKSLSTMKHALSVDLTLMPKNVTVSGKIVTEQLLDLIDTIVKSPEANNTSLLAMLIGKFGVSLKLGEAAYQRGWVHNAIKDGKPRFLCFLLQLPGLCDIIAKKPSEILLLAGKHERCRIPLCQVLLRFAVALGLSKRKSELEVFWCDVLDNVANTRKLHANEDQTGRLSLVQYLCTTPDVVRVNHERHRKDGFNVFLRACRDGDADVVELLLSKGLVTDVNERAKDKDGSTALVLASLGGHKAIVEQLLKTGRVDVLMTVKDKTAYVLAQDNFKNPLLIAMLRKAQQDAEGQSKKAVAQAKIGSFRGLPEANASLEAAKDPSAIPITKPDTPPELLHDSSPAAHLSMATTPAGQRLSPQEFINLFHTLNVQYQRLDMGSDQAVILALTRLRQDVAARLARDGTVRVPAAATAEVVDVLDRVVELGDPQVGGPELLRACALHLDPTSFDFRAAADDREWPLMAARNGSPVILSIVLAAVGELPETTATNVIIAASKSEARLEVARVLLDNSRSWRKLRGALQPLWQQFFENVGLSAGASQREEPSRRFALLDKMLKHRDIEIAFETEASDGYTLFARACAHGDVEFVQFMIDRHVLEDPNKQLSDGTNPLLQAVAGDHVEVVELLLRTKVVDAAAFLPGIGTALDAAVKLKRHHRIVDCLRAAVGLPSAHRADGNSGHQTGRRTSMRIA